MCLALKSQKSGAYSSRATLVRLAKGKDSMKKLSILTVLLVVWLCVPTQASADGPWQYQINVYTQTVKEIAGWVYEPGKPYPLHYSTVSQSLRQQGYHRQWWSAVGNGGIIYHHFVRMARVPIAPVFLMAPAMFLQQVNPLYYPARTG